MLRLSLAGCRLCPGWFRSSLRELNMFPFKDNWKESRDHFFDSILPKLKEHGQEIGRKQDECEHCKNIIKYYAMLETSFDPITCDLLEKELESYLKTA